LLKFDHKKGARDCGSSRLKRTPRPERFGANKDPEEAGEGEAIDVLFLKQKKELRK